MSNSSIFSKITRIFSSKKASTLKENVVLSVKKVETINLKTKLPKDVTIYYYTAFDKEYVHVVYEKNKKFIAQGSINITDPVTKKTTSRLVKMDRTSVFYESDGKLIS